MCTTNKGLDSVNIGQGRYYAMSHLNAKSISSQVKDTCVNSGVGSYVHDRQLKMTASHSELEPVSVFDVAAYILSKVKECTTMKLHKLLYYCQAWHLVWTDTPIFEERIEAWANGPVIKVLFNVHRGLYTIHYEDFSLGNPARLTQTQRESVDEVLNFYGDKTAQWLINQTHIETPWQEARKGLDQTERSSKEISIEAIHDYYASLV